MRTHVRSQSRWMHLWQRGYEADRSRFSALRPRFHETARMPDPVGRAHAGLSKTVPALPVRDVGAAVAQSREPFGFDAPHEAEDFAVLARDDAVLHLWGASDEDWRSRDNLTAQPICSGAESFLA